MDIFRDLTWLMVIYMMNQCIVDICVNIEQQFKLDWFFFFFPSLCASSLVNMADKGRKDLGKIRLPISGGLYPVLILW